jgi:hypothetical protein
MYKTAIVASNIIDKSKICRGFNNHISKHYGDLILNRNDMFFTQEDIHLQINNEEVVHFISKLKSFWKDLKITDKDIVWKYFRLLVILSTKAHT